MPSIRKKETKSGQPFYEVSVSQGRGKSRLTRRWYPPDGWSRKAIERELAAVAAEFERQSDAREVISRAEQRDRETQAAAEAAKILTLHQYGERVFMPSKSITMSENSRANYQSYLDKKIYPALGDVKLPEITSAQLTALLLDIQAEGKAHSTVIKVYTILHSFFKMAYLGDMIPHNPMDKVERPKPRKDEVKENMTVLSCKIRKEQAVAFKAHCENQGSTSNTVLKDFVLGCIGEQEPRTVSEMPQRVPGRPAGDGGIFFTQNGPGGCPECRRDGSTVCRTGSGDTGQAGQIFPGAGY